MRPDEVPPPVIFLGLFSCEPGRGIELTLEEEGDVNGDNGDGDGGDNDDVMVMLKI